MESAGRKLARISVCSPLQTDQWGITTKESSEMRERTTGAPTEGTVSEQHPELHNLVLEMAPKKAKKRTDSNVFSMFEQAQIQEFKEAFTIMDQNRDGFIDKADLRDTFAALGRLNVKNEELDDMIKEAPGPINFTVFLSMFGEKLKGADPEETILNAFKVFDPESKGLKANYIKEMLMTQGERFSKEEVDQMFAAFPPDVTGNLDYKNLVHIITHGEEKD
ncbi:myosin regulatory light chain 2, ventricular/cardiac muscle isoform [Crotalus tigris]|uniref:myosin regulatory light chain 2, ventricular/cardiac muscle isoform n=1 Tax=Crotalus tigris TaxID=88082 RepID=UPI00192F47E6|nr:myosin regulatory light chain 2, ventricular/cardiac muscle isoform [Crotalus tigris]